jgi:hypothetical protein
MVSIIIPCHNQARFLGEAIASVSRSAQKDVEIVVVDDGSSDETVRVATSFAGTRCVSQPRGGLARARNHGLKESTGRYLVFLDADDALAPGGLDVGVAELAARPTAAFVFGQCRTMSDEGTVEKAAAQLRIERDHYRELLKRNYIWTPAAVMFRREDVERAGGFDPSVNASADYGMYLRIARSRPIHDHGQVVAYYRKHSGNMSADSARMLQETLTVLRRERPFVEGDPTLLAAYYEGWAHWQDFYGSEVAAEISQHVRARHWGRALRKAAALGWLHPQGLARHATKKLSLSLRRRERGRTGGQTPV